MKRSLTRSGIAALAAAGGLALALPASAKTDPKKDEARLRWAHTYAAAAEEAKERNCVIFATMHIDH
jgi:hypothetical protein